MSLASPSPNQPLLQTLQPQQHLDDLHCSVCARITACVTPALDRGQLRRPGVQHIQHVATPTSLSPAKSQATDSLLIAASPAGFVPQASFLDHYYLPLESVPRGGHLIDKREEKFLRPRNYAASQRSVHMRCAGVSFFVHPIRRVGSLD